MHLADSCPRKGPCGPIGFLCSSNHIPTLTPQIFQSFSQLSESHDNASLHGTDDICPTPATGASAPSERFPAKAPEYQSQDGFVKWAKNTMCGMDKVSLMGEMEVARMQQEFARDPQRVPLVHNKARLCPVLLCPFQECACYHCLLTCRLPPLLCDGVCCMSASEPGDS